jgi:ninein
VRYAWFLILLYILICLAVIKQILISVRLSLEHMSGERDKLRADIMDANQRASLLAQEVDDHHARLEKSSQLQVR